MSSPPSTAAATEALTVGRTALRQLHDSLLRDAPDFTVPILQEVGFAAGAGVFQAFCAWLPAETGVARPDDLDAGRLNDVLSAFFQATGWGSVRLADFFGRLSGEPVAVMEVECRSRNDERCRFLSASPDTLNAVYEEMTRGHNYEEVLGVGD